MSYLLLGAVFAGKTDKIKCMVKICEDHNQEGTCCTITKWADDGEKVVKRSSWVDVWDGHNCPGNDQASSIEFLETDQEDPFQEDAYQPWYRCRFKLYEHDDYKGSHKTFKGHNVKYNFEFSSLTGVNMNDLGSSFKLYAIDKFTCALQSADTVTRCNSENRRRRRVDVLRRLRLHSRC